jgi:hypothetical protein
MNNKGFYMFNEAGSGNPVVVNAAQVRFVRPHGDNTSVIHFESGLTLSVHGTIQTVLTNLQSALS